MSMPTTNELSRGNSFNALILSVDLLKLHNKSASFDVVVDKPIIPRCSFFSKGHFLALTGMFSLMIYRFVLLFWSSHCAPLSLLSIKEIEHQFGEFFLFF